MAVYVVSYDLNKTGQKYKDLFEELEKSPGWCREVDSTWLISTTETAEQLWQRISPSFDANDRCMIVNATRPFAGWLSEPTWEWIRANL